MMREAGSRDMTDVYIEKGTRRVFACAVDWPGWCRSGKTEEAALEALGASTARYAAIAKRARVPFDASTPARFSVKERLAGSMTTDFGAPGSIPRSDRRTLSSAEAVRIAELLEASWAVLDNLLKKAPARLRKGPRGGGRDRDEIGRHVIEAEDAYARKVGVRIKDPAARRNAMLEAIRSGSAEIPEKGWPLRYAARRTAWHAIDHAWEIEDRSE